MYSKTCPIPVKNVRDKLIEMTPLSSLLSDWMMALLDGVQQQFSLMEYIGVAGEDNRPVASHWQTLLHNLISSTTPHH